MAISKNLTGSYTHLPSPMKSYVLSILAIALSAVPSAVFSAWVWKAYGLEGIPFALATVFSAMVLATALFAAITSIGRAFKIMK